LDFGLIRENPTLREGIISHLGLHVGDQLLEIKKAIGNFALGLGRKRIGRNRNQIQRRNLDGRVKLSLSLFNGRFVVRGRSMAMTCWRKTVPTKSNCYKPVGSINELPVENAFELVFKMQRVETRKVPLF